MTACFAHAGEKFYRIDTNPIYKSGLTEFYRVRTKIDNKNYKYGIADAKNNIILPVEYGFIWPNNGNGVVVDAYDYKNKKHNYGYFSLKERRFLLPCEYEDISCGHVALAACMVKKDGKYGYVSFEGEELIPMKYKSKEVYRYNMFGYNYKADKQNYIVAEDFNNKKCIYTIYSDNKDKKKSAKLTDCIYDEIEQIYSSRFAFKKGENKGEISFYTYLDKNGSKQFIPYEYDTITPFNNNGVYMVEKDGKKGIYSASLGEHNFGSEIIVPIEYNSLEHAGWGLYKFCKEGKCGAYDKKTQRFIELKYKNIIAVNDSKIQLITDKTKRVVSRYTFGEKVDNFKKGFFMILLSPLFIFDNFDS